MLFTDSHCHIDFKELYSQLPKLLEECRNKGIHRIVVPAITPKNWPSVLALKNINKKVNIRSCLGIHPWYLAGLNEQDLMALSKLIDKNRDDIVAVGEAGVDIPIANQQNNLAQQLHFFETQTTFAKQFDLPLIVHHRRSHQYIEPILKKAKLPKAGIIHAFSGSYQQAKNYVDLGFKLGIGGTITYPRAEKTIKAIKRLPLEALVLETDAPAMPLYGYQGQANSPLQIIKVFECLAEIRQETAEQLAEQIETNISQLFV